jgi:ubiquinone/menaquinone biosynthesis C-methylase UbiE
MKYDFSGQEKAQEYLKFSISDEGLKQQALVWEGLKSLLPSNKNLQVVDAGCGTGWLTNKLTDHFNHVLGFDSSQALLEHGKQQFPKANFMQADYNQRLPLPDSNFDLAIASLVLHDLPDLQHGFSELARIIKPGGQLLVVELNPYYAHPVGSWKRNLWQKITRTKPKLNLSSYMAQRRLTDRTFGWLNFFSLFYTLPEMINAALAAGFELKFIEDIGSRQDSKKLDLNYRAYRFPIFIVYQFTRRA